jgi:5-methylcytosine-specific restriction endonuclease McrA
MRVYWRPGSPMFRLRMRQQRGRCAYCACRLTPDNCTRDHFIPVSLDGRRGWANIVLTCGRCNKSKSDVMPTHRQWLQFLQLTEQDHDCHIVIL